MKTWGKKQELSRVLIPNKGHALSKRGTVRRNRGHVKVAFSTPISVFRNHNLISSTLHSMIRTLVRLWPFEKLDRGQASEQIQKNDFETCSLSGLCFLEHLKTLQSFLKVFFHYLLLYLFFYTPSKIETQKTSFKICKLFYCASFEWQGSFTLWIYLWVFKKG